MKWWMLLPPAAVAAAVLAAPRREAPAPLSAETALAADMADAARRFLSALSPAERKRAGLAFDSGERTRWRYVPGARAGLTLGELSPVQRHLADGLIATALSRRGVLKATTIMALEEVLRRRGGGSLRDPGAYALAVWGEPSTGATWGWRLEGHHLSLNATLIGGTRLVVAPTFLGANPGRVDGDLLGHTRVLGREEDLALALVASLDGEQRKQAIAAADAPADILTGPGEALGAMRGVAASALDAGQRRTLDALVDEILGHLAPELATRERARLDAQGGTAGLVFSWAGPTTLARPHYVRLSGPTFLYELDNTQDGANHVHTVWHAREPGGDFGLDLLREHYRSEPHGATVSPREQAMLAEIRGNWARPIEPFRLVGNIYYVGAANIASYLIATSEGLILLDTGTREMLPALQANIVALGFRIEDVKLILCGHAHFDHVEGHAAMKRLTGATVAAMEADVPALSSGKDLSALAGPGWEPVAVDRVLHDGDEVALGDVRLKAIWTPGHTQGNTTFVTTARDGGRSYQVVFVGVPLANAGVKLAGNPRHPTLVEDLARTHRVLKTLAPDIWLYPHPEEQLAGKLDKLRAGVTPNALVDPEGYRKLIAEAEAETAKALREEH